MNCHNCNNPLQQGFKFCPHCGAEATATRVCPNCRSEVKPDWKACPSCGTALNKAASHYQQAKPTFHPKHGYGKGSSSGRYYGSSSYRKRRRKGFLGRLFSS